ncbi:plasma-membrane calcium-translocating P-type ATPase [Desulfosporosinus orientis DSM 765]|uniref:P-type Ca(2+) transporter n=1 Tax=Desulfosporosinus orientis (strain ATCC 19365 / DSM 765 / NCIMB 8382 / VKM B-1628 / Singapore I) TaxID=768706 RepID=G7WIQ0_DESOD|nr:calcium-translocating P-type ATPase, PMCA-type [Desulfosporosinus orientis]AET69124.1 plasma-membrane calcium-translocating P-type ATPase [Desulfosporosinus orientis DSM 765]
MDFFQKEAEEVIIELQSNEETGLSAVEADKRIKQYGKNVFTPKEKDSIFAKIIDSLKEPLILILLISGVISLAMGHLADGLGIFAAVLIATSISIIQEGKSDKAFEALSKLSEDVHVKVVRDQEIVLLSQSELTIGDIIHLETGDKVPADARIIHSSSLGIDESMLTGEAEAASKNSSKIDRVDCPLAERKNMLYSGTMVIEGRAIAIVTSIGDRTEMGKIADELKGELNAETPLQEKLADLGKRISIIGSIVAAAIFLFEVFRMYTQGILVLDNIGTALPGIKDAFVTSVALIVAAVPEGLPTMVAITLAFNMQKMAKNNALVRKLIACETIGSVNVICSDKTGTLTENKMTVVEVWSDGKEVPVDQLRNQEMLMNFCLNSTADISQQGENYEFLGNPTECSLLVCADKNNVNYLHYRKQYSEPVSEYNFTSARKMMSTAYETDQGFRLYTKGSPEKVLSICNRILYNGVIIPMTQEHIQEIEAKIKDLQDNARRVLAFAFTDFAEEPQWEDIYNVEKNLVYTGFVGIEDPLRSDVKEAINHCRQAGITVKILTGDNINTARAIATQLGIVKEDSLVLEVTDIDAMSDEELKSKLPKIVVIARSNPTAKMRVVKLLQEINASVVVTGDGINDAPALKAADVGVAMGIAGTEVSKEASDIVLLDDSFSTIVKAIKWGRGIYENFQRFIQFQLTVNVVAFLTVILAEVMGYAMPFTTLQLLWVNIIMDGPPALTLGLEPPREHLLKQQPIKRNASIVTKDMLLKIVANGMFIVAALLFVMNTQLLGGTEAQQSTIVFTSFVLFQLWNAFNSREFGVRSIFPNLLKNKMMVGVIILTFFIQVLVTQFGGEVFKTVPLDLTLWVKMIGFTFSIVIFSEALKLIMRLFQGNPQKA